MHAPDRPFTATLIRGTTERVRLWDYQTWRPLSVLFESILASRPGPEGVRIYQYPLGESLRKHVPYGPLRLNDASNQKWTHGSPLTGSKGASWYLMAFECWSPSWTVLKKSGSPHPSPDVFLGIRTESPGMLPSHQPRTQDLVLAIADDCTNIDRPACSSFLSKVAQELDTKDVSRFRRPWLRPFLSGFANPLPFWFNLHLDEKQEPAETISL